VKRTITFCKVHYEKGFALSYYGRTKDNFDNDTELLDINNCFNIIIRQYKETHIIIGGGGDISSIIVSDVSDTWFDTAIDCLKVKLQRDVKSPDHSDFITEHYSLCIQVLNKEKRVIEAARAMVKDTNTKYERGSNIFRRWMQEIVNKQF